MCLLVRTIRVGLVPWFTARPSLRTPTKYSPLRQVREFQPIFALSREQTDELLAYLKSWSVLRRCCGTQMSATYRAFLHNSTNAPPAASFCGTYDISEVEHTFLRHRLTRTLGQHIHLINHLSDNDGALTGDYCRRTNSAIGRFKLPFNADLQPYDRETSLDASTRERERDDKREFIEHKAPNASIPSSELTAGAPLQLKSVLSASGKPLLSASSLRCSSAPPPRAGQSGRMGVLLVAAGTPLFVQSQVLPAIEHLSSILGIPDSAHRINTRGQPLWALSTEPHLCDGPLLGVLPFFDHVTIAPSQMVPSASNPSLHPSGYQSLRLVEEREDPALRNWVKAVKLQSILFAPYDVTIYLDFDTKPCRPDFALMLLQALGSADVALTNVKDGGSGADSIKHWIKRGASGKETTNLHNSACVVFNLSSGRTRTLLEKWRDTFFASDPPATLDQPALGEALYTMALRGETVMHVDLGPKLFCRWANVGDRVNFYQMEAQCGISRNSECTLVHTRPHLSAQQPLSGEPLNNASPDPSHVGRLLADSVAALGSASSLLPSPPTTPTPQLPYLENARTLDKHVMG